MMNLEAPWDVLERLREIDAGADLLYVGEGQWMLGVYRPGQTRKTFAEKQLRGLIETTPDDDDLPPWAVVAKYRKMRDGFAPVTVVRIHNGLFGELIHDFRVADWNFRNRADAAFEENLSKSDLDELKLERMRQMEDFADSEAAAIHRFTHRHPVSIVMPKRGKPS